MTAKRLLFVILIASGALLIARNSGVRALPPKLPAAHTLGAVEPDSEAVEAAPAATTAHLGREIIVSDLNNVQHLPAVAYNWKHDEYLVVWHNQWGGGGRDVYAQRITGQGELKSWFAVSAGANDRAQPSVAYDPVHDRYLVVWIYDASGNGSNWDIFGRFIPWEGPSGNLNEFPIIEWPVSSQWNPKVVYARAQEEFLVVWWNEHPSVPAYISARRVFADGSGFPSNSSDLTIDHGTENRVNPDVAYNLARNEYLVTYDNGLDIFGMRLRGDGVALGGGEFGIAGWPDTETKPAVAACREADQYLVVWQSMVGSDHDLFARFIHGDGSPQSVHPISEFAGHQEEADVDCNAAGRQYLVTWQEQLATYGISARPVNPDKTLEPGFQIVAPGIAPGHNDAAVAGGSVNYLVVWEHQRGATAFRDIHGRIVTPHSLFLPVALRRG